MITKSSRTQVPSYEEFGGDPACWWEGAIELVFRVYLWPLKLLAYVVVGVLLGLTKLVLVVERVILGRPVVEATKRLLEPEKPAPRRVARLG